MQYLDNLEGAIYQDTLMDKYRILYENWSAANLIFIYLNIAYIKSVHDINSVNHEEWKTIIDVLLNKWDDVASLTDPLFSVELLSRDLIEDYEIPDLDEYEDDIVERAKVWYANRFGIDL
jgi:hypothetical protein